MGKEPKKRPRGRPTKGDTALMSPIMIRFSQEMLAEIDGLIEARRDRPDRSGFIRELIAEALAARAEKRRRG